MKRRIVRKLLKLGPYRVLPYGRHHSRGSRKLQRGRRAFLAYSAPLRDWNHLPWSERLRLLWCLIARMEMA